LAAMLAVFLFGVPHMAGTLFGLGLSQQNDVNGKPMPGCLLYTYAAGSSTPVSAFRDSGLSLQLPWPLQADATGRLPQFWLPDGNYRARLTDAVGAQQFDEDNILALGPSTGVGGGGPTVNPDSLSSTGDIKPRADETIISGWVRLNGKTIGSASSGATEHGNADAQPLFEYLWNGFPDSICPVVGGRGASSVADWNANKQITLPDARGRSLFGTADMGGADTGALDTVPFTKGDKSTPGSQGGESLHTLTPTELAVHRHLNTVGETPHIHQLHNNSAAVNGTSPSQIVASINSVAAGNPNLLGTTDPATAGVTINNVDAGGGAAHNNTPQFLLVVWFMRL
jgi:hypothetical protein